MKMAMPKGIKLESKCLNCGKKIRGKKRNAYCRTCRSRRFKDSINKRELKNEM